MKVLPEPVSYQGVKVNEEGAVLCPVCGFDYAYLSKVIIDQGKWVTVVDGRNDTLREENPPAHQRGSNVSVCMACEEGHLFAVRFGFHKGITYLHCLHTATIEDGEGFSEEMPPSLWRD